MSKVHDSESALDGPGQGRTPGPPSRAGAQLPQGLIPLPTGEPIQRGRSLPSVLHPPQCSSVKYTTKKVV